MPQALKPTPPPLDEEEPRERKPERVREPGSGKGVLVGIGIAALVVAVIAFMIGHGGGSSGGGAPTNASSSSTLEASFPAGWSELGSPPEIPGMTLDDPIAVAPKGGGSSVVFGQVKEEANNSTLLPAGFLVALGSAGKTPKRQAVQLAGSKLQAYRYENLRPKGLKSPVTVFTVPTSEGVATLACIAPGPDCESIASTFKLSSGTAFPVGPSKDYASALSKQLGDLNKAVSSGRSGLSAKTPAAQGAAARKLGAAYAAAAKGLQDLKLSPADKVANLQLSTALEQTGSAYDKLGAAAAKGDRGGYGRAGKLVAAGQTAIGKALDGLKAVGYAVAS